MRNNLTGEMTSTPSEMPTKEPVYGTQPVQYLPTGDNWPYKGSWDPKDQGVVSVDRTFTRHDGTVLVFLKFEGFFEES